MATTTNFGWTTPNDTDLVKDGASAIRTLGSSIDASMAELKGGTTGQVLSKTSNTDMDFTWVAQDDSNAIQNAIVDAKGDLIAATANDTPARLAVGANNTVLTADSSTATGLKWATASSGAMTLISTTTLSATASTITFSSIPSTYQHLKIILSATGSNDFMRMYFNNVTTSTYYSEYVQAYGTNNVYSGELLGSGSMRCGMKDTTSASIIDIPDYKNTTIKKMFTAVSGYRGGTGTGATRTWQFFGTNDATTAVTQIDITSDTTFGIGSVFSLYGVS